MWSENWEQKQLSSVISKVVDNRGKTPVNSAIGEHELIEVNAISNTYKYPQYKDVRKYVDDQTYNTWFRAGHPIIGDVLVPTVGSLGAVSYVNENRGCIAQNLIALRANTELCTGQFLYYSLRNPILRQELLNLDIGGVQPSIKVPHLLGLTLGFPPVMEQNKITATLSSLDDKIELNNRIIAKLEAQAQAIFKSWFVDFEPCQDGEFVESELGLIPKGWRCGTFSEIIEKLIPGDWGKDNPEGNNTQEVFCIRGADIPEVRNGNKGKMPIRYILAKNFVSKQLEANDLVAEISGGSPTQSTGRIALVTKSLLGRYDKPMICTNFCKAMKPITGFAAFIYYYWQYLYDQNVLFSYENGTTGIKNLNINGFVEVESIVIPDDSTAIKFNEIVMGFQEMVFSLGKQNEQLALTRDTLLPKLMSGEIEVPVNC